MNRKPDKKYNSFFVQKRMIEIILYQMYIEINTVD